MKRNDEWQSLDIAELSDTEMLQVFKTESQARVLQFLIAVVGWIREHVEVIDQGDEHGV